LAAVLFALLIHWIIFRFALKGLQIKAVKFKSVARLGFIILAIKLVLPFIAVPESMELIISRAVSLCLVASIGWLTLVLLQAFTDYSISRHRIDVEDNLHARKMRTRLRVLRQACSVLVVIITVGAMLIVFPDARAIGVSVFASAGVAGIIIGFAARPVLANLLAGLQIALAQPIRIDDAVVIEGEWGWIEEITATYVVVKIWDWRRLIVPLSYVIEKPFQNWTRETAAIIGTVTWEVDFSVPIEKMREQLQLFLKDSPHWDKDVQVLQVIESGQKTMTLRALMSAKNSPTAWDLRCEIREKMIAWLQVNYPDALPKHRALITDQAITRDPLGI
jgi:small-conductance mechanosensitive channel